MQPLLIRIVLEHQLPPLKVVDNTLDDLVINGRAPVTTPDAAVFTDPIIIYVIRTVYNDGALPGKIVDPGLETIEPERIAVLAVIGFPGLKKPDTGLVTTFHVGESGRFEIPGIFAVSNQVPKQQLALLQIENP